MEETVSVTRYSVIRFVPDPVRGEFVNLGIIAVRDDGHAIAVRTTSNWKRVNRFAPEAAKLARRVVGDLKAALEPRNFELGATMITGEDLQRMSIEYRNLVQLTEPMLSLADVEQTADEEYARFVEAGLKVEDHVRAQPRTDLYNHAKFVLEESIKARFQVAKLDENIVRRREPVMGQFAEHNFGLALRNGRLYAAAQAISFAVDLGDAKRDMNAVAWDVSDVKKAAPSLELAVLLGKPHSDTTKARELYEEAAVLFGKLQADVISEGQIDEWANKTVSRIPKSAVIRN